MDFFALINRPQPPKEEFAIKKNPNYKNVNSGGMKVN